MSAAFPDLNDPGASPDRRKQPTRRETILSLVEMLLQRNEDSGQADQQPNFEDDKDVPSVDEHLQVVGAETFNKFQRRVNALDKELRAFANSTRQLGSSAGILSAAFNLREGLAHILNLYRENAADLFPRKVTRNTPQPMPDTGKKRRRLALAKPRAKISTNVTRLVDEKVDPEEFPSQFKKLAKYITAFANCLNEFPEFTDDAVNASILSFEGDLLYWASCLEEYQGQFRYPSVQRYLHDLTSEMGEHLDNITTTISMFIEVGVPAIRFAQRHGSNNLQNLSTVATFFSAVTATTIQFSYQLDKTSPLAAAVNCFWFASLVFSIAAAVNSLLGLTWKQAMYRSPRHRVPWWVLIWIKRSPLLFLVFSVACFSIGLCLFAYASNQDRVTSAITTVLTSITSFGLAAVSAWFASERWTFGRHRGNKWLSDVLIESKDHAMGLPGVPTIRKSYRELRKKARGLRNEVSRIGSRTLSLLSTNSSEDDRGDDLEGNLPVSATHERHGSGAIPMTPQSRFANSSLPMSASPEPMSPGSVPGSPLSETPTPINSTPVASPTQGRQLWSNAIRTVKMRSAVSSNLAALAGIHTPRRQRTTSSTLTGDRKKTVMEEPIKAISRSRVTGLKPRLKCLEPVQDMAAHQALVRHLQFSPDGKFLATSSWDRTSVVFRVGEKGCESHRILAHARGFVGQVAWSPTGNILLTKLVRGIKIWTEDGVCKKTIDRPVNVESITWLPDSTGFLSVEGSDVTKLDLSGKVLGQYHFGKMKLHDVAVSPEDGLRLLGVGPLSESPSGLKPSKSRGEKRLVVFNTETGLIENQTPVLNDVRDVTLSQNSKNGIVALVSYENKAPPQLWKMDLVKDRENSSLTTGRLTLRHTYMPKAPVDFAGPSYFGGKNDELVLCAGKAGDIHIWDQESGALLHHVRAQAVGGDLTCIAWNHAAEDPFMFATGSHDGAVRIWSKPQDAPEDPGTVLRSASPFTYQDIEDISRTESPFSSTPLDRGSTDSLDSTATGNMLSPRERMVAFAADNPVSEGVAT
ncbi:quinon protein alcohol dehydrogenase-like superfamily [Mycena floridula]|nr:quinon protein alcohol dehydrogenase-like superfamily [Mycena floridula]